jgi:hypothetical protein
MAWIFIIPLHTLYQDMMSSHTCGVSFDHWAIVFNCSGLYHLQDSYYTKRELRLVTRQLSYDLFNHISAI